MHLTPLEEQLAVALEPSLRRHAEALVANAAGQFDDSFASVLAYGPCGPGSNFAKRAETLKR